MAEKALARSRAPHKAAPQLPHSKADVARLTLRSVRTLERTPGGTMQAGAKRYDDAHVRQLILDDTHIGREAVMYFTGCRWIVQVAHLVELGLLPRPNAVHVDTGQWMWADPGKILAACDKLRTCDGAGFKMAADWLAFCEGEGGEATLARLEHWQSIEETKRKAEYAAHAATYQQKLDAKAAKIAAEEAKQRAFDGKMARYAKEYREFRTLEATPTRTTSEQARYEVLVPVHCERYKARMRAVRDAQEARRKAAQDEFARCFADIMTTRRAITDAKNSRLYQLVDELYSELDELSEQKRELALAVPH